MRNKLKKLMPAPVLKLFKELRYVWIVGLFHLFHLIPINKKRIVLCNVWGFGDNAKYVTKELARRQLKESIELIYVTNHPLTTQAPSNVTVVKTNSIKAIYYLSTARIWLDNNRKESYIRKKKGQYYIQTWHGGIALKKIEKDYETALGKKYVSNAKRDSKMTDLYISNSNFCTRMYRNSFWYHGDIKEFGSPRNDVLLSHESSSKEKICKILNIPTDYKIAIYAPTYREGGNIEAYRMDFNKILEHLTNRFSNKWVIAVRLHPLVASLSDFITYNKSVINATNYGDIYELMAAGDVLFTDYSNLMFEFSFMKKPVFLYALDINEYDKDRGFYFDYANLPYYKAYEMNELLDNIENYSEDEYHQRIEEFFQKIDLYESGNASKLVADHILEVLQV